MYSRFCTCPFRADGRGSEMGRKRFFGAVIGLGWSWGRGGGRGISGSRRGAQCCGVWEVLRLPFGADDRGHEEVSDFLFLGEWLDG